MRMPRRDLWMLITGAGLVIVATVLLFDTGTVHASVRTSHASAHGTAQSTKPQQLSVQPLHAVVIGDSYTSGEVLDDPELRFTTLIARMMGWDEHNFALGGTGYLTGFTTEFGDYPDYDDELPQTDPNADVVLVTGGGNDVDAWALSDDPAAEIDHFYDDLRDRYPTATIYVVSPFWNADPEPDDLPDIRDAVEAAATRIGADYLDIGKPLYGRPELVLPDGDHPNAWGNRVIASRILAQIS